jgi:phage shock protein C
METKKGLYRSRTDTVIGGVAGGIAKSLNIDSFIVRLLFILMALWGGGILLYVILWIALPLDDYIFEQPNKKNMDKENNAQGPKDTKDTQNEMWHKSKNDGSLIAGLILIALGVIFLIVRFIPRIDFGDLWPIILIVAGIALLRSSYIKPKKNQS